jgi:hypothetical protein
MGARLLVVAAIYMWGCAGSAPSQPTANTGSAKHDMPIPADLRDQVSKSSEIGRQLYILDKVAAIGTDVLLENINDLKNKGIGGYMPMREGDDDGRPKDSWMVTFFTTETPPRIAYEIRVSSGVKPEFQAFSPAKEGTKSFVAFVRAQRMAIAAMPHSEQPINPVIIPGEANGENGVLVYLLAGTNKPNVAVFGRHFRALVPIEGSSVSYMMPLSNSAVELPTKGPNGEVTEALMVTQVVTDFPLETHVFTSLLMKLPVYVGTRRGVWRVDGDKISLVTDVPTKGL